MPLTRDDATHYYAAMAKLILPHLRNRPLSFKRYVDDIGGEFFWEKDAPSFTPAWVKRFPVPRREGGPPIDYIVCNSARTLAWLAGAGGIELHPFLHKIPRIDVATHVVFDLDPGEGADILLCAQVALLLRDALPLQSFAKVSGSKGIQVYVPLNDGRATHEQTETFARLVAEELARRHPKLVVAKMSKALRRGKVFIDWSQNAGYKTTVAVYSLRATGLVSMPVRWAELSRPRTLQWTPADALKRVRRVGDLFAPVLEVKQSLGGRHPSSGPSLRSAPPSPRTRGEGPPARTEARKAAPLVAPRPAKRGEGGAERRVRGGLPKPSSQSGRRLFLVTKTETGNELWLDVGGRFKRFILRPDRAGGGALIAMPAGQFSIEAPYYRAEVPERWKGRVGIEDSGAYEVIEGSWPRGRVLLWFNGRVLSRAWLLEKVEKSDRHRSWRLTPR